MYSVPHWTAHSRRMEGGENYICLQLFFYIFKFDSFFIRENKSITKNNKVFFHVIEIHFSFFNPPQDQRITVASFIFFVAT